MGRATCLEAGDTAAVLGLLRSGTDVNTRLPDGFTPLMIAATHGRYHLAQALLTAGADVHAREPRGGATALHKAAHAGNPDVIGLLLDHGAFADQQTPTLGNTPLFDAVLHKHRARSSACCTLYWLTATAGSSAPVYWNSMRSFREHAVEVPVGDSQFPRDICPAWKRPETFVDEVRASLRHSASARAARPARRR